MSLEPFSVLGCAPTLELAEIKRAYYLSLPRHPPHADPEGFRRLRAAYEELLSSERRTARYMDAALSPEAMLAEYRAGFEAKLQTARASSLGAGTGAWELNSRFAEVFGRMSLAQALERSSAGASPKAQSPPSTG